MKRTLIVTNGQSGVDAIRSCLRTEAEILAWEDVLHDGPVPYRESLAEISKVRVEYLSGLAEDYPEITPDRVKRQFERRDTLISRCADFDETVLWFDHDLYDQLQLMQVGWVLASALSNELMPRVSYVVYRDYLLPENRQKMLDAFADRQPLSRADCDELARLWCIFTDDTPAGLDGELSMSGSRFLEVPSALRRLCQEYPSVESGLTRNETQILEVLEANETLSPGQLFRKCQALEEVPYLGDTSFWTIVQRMTAVATPLISVRNGERFMLPGKSMENFLSQELSLMPAGRAIIAGSRTHVPYEKWIGGVHLSRSADWRWNEGGQQIVRL